MSGQGSYGGPPGAPAQTVNYPVNTGFVTFEVFETLNTKPARPAIKDSEMYICDGWMPFGPSNARTLPGIGDSIYSAPDGLTLVAFWFYNLSANTYAAALLSDGSLVQIATDTGVTTQIMPTGTIASPNPNATWMAQWNAKYLIIVSSQTNGYWLWDGANLYSAGGVSPDGNITSSGSNYTSQPMIVFQSTNNAAVPPTFSTVIKNGFVTEVGVITPGSGFSVDDFNTITFTGGGSDNAAIATANISANSGGLSGAYVTTPGQKYLTTDVVVLSGGGGTGASVSQTVVEGGAIESLAVLKPGMGYTSAPTLSINTSGGAGSGFTGFTTISTGAISSISITDGGTGYKSPPTVTIIGDGTGATAIANISPSGQVVSVTVTLGGSGYTKALVVFSGGNNAAEASISLMPFGIQGSTVEVYSNRVWVGDDRNGYFTAPASVSDFTPSNGAGAFQSNDSFQRRTYTSYRQTNGFLYLLSDSSMNYIGGVQTSGANAATTFSNLNVTPAVGSPWPSSVQLFDRNLVFANSFGIFVSYGGAVQKISTPLDGLYNSAIGTAGSVNGYPSSAMANLFGVACYMLLLPVVDQVSGSVVSKLLIWSGRNWFTSSQDSPLTYVASQEIDSQLTAWGTDGTNLFSLFQTPSDGFTKTIQSKLFSVPTYWIRKVNPELAGLLNFYNTVGEVDISIDNENGSSDVVTVQASSTANLIWTNNADEPITWTNNASQDIVWGSPGIALVGPQSTGQVGVLIGMTISTSAKDVALLSMSLLDTAYQPRN